MSTGKVWFITGVSSGMGEAIAQQVLQQGGRVVGTLRRAEQIPAFEALAPAQAVGVQLDVTQPASIEAAVQAALARFGRIDVLVNNAGYGLVGALEESSDEDAQRVFETNFFGAMRVTRAVLPTLRQQRGGHIINMSAIAGFSAFPGFGVYSASKFALEGLSEALAQEVKPLGIQVTIITLGVFRTRFAGNALQFTETIIDDYAATVGGFRGHISQLDGKQPNDPIKAAQAILQIAETENPPLRLFLGEDSVNWAAQKMAQVQQDLTAWDSLNRAMTFDDVTA